MILLKFSPVVAIDTPLDLEMVLLSEHPDNDLERELDRSCQFVGTVPKSQRDRSTSPRLQTRET